MTFNHSEINSPRTVLVVQNEVIVNLFNGCGGNSLVLTFILFYECGYFATSCDNNTLYLHFSNGTSTCRTITTPTNPRYIGFDSKGHFIQLSYGQISIYN